MYETAGLDEAGAGEAARRVLQAVVRQLPAGEAREGQLDMCAAVAEALASGRHLVVEAGTGVGKSLAYLVAAVLSGRRVVVATARKPLQDQLMRKDIPFLAGALGVDVDAALLKGRSNYLCLAKLAEATGGGQGELIDDGGRRADLVRLEDWAETPGAGDLGDAPLPLDRALRSMVTVGARECPGAAVCEHGEACLAEHALERARQARLVVTNIDLYCFDMAVGGAILGEHEAVVIDEAHELEAIATRTFGLELGRGRLAWLAGQLRGLLVQGATEPRRLEAAGERLAGALGAYAGRAVDLSDPELADALAGVDDAVAGAGEVLRRLPPDAADGRRQRAVQAGSSLLEDVRVARAPRPGDVAWVPGGNDPVLRVAAVDVGPALAELAYARRTVILTSATLSVGGDLEPMARRIGLRPELLASADARPGPHASRRVSSPFRYREQAVLYCAAHLPDPRRAPERFDSAAIEELAALVAAAGGRTLALFTSHRMLRLAADALRTRFDWAVLEQQGPPEPGLIERFREDERACLLATMGYWQGVDVPGRSLSLVAIDRLPFPPPGDPLLDARRRAAAMEGRNPFESVDLPLAATMLAQGAGRLVRASTDRGVVAVLDKRLARAAYRRALLDSLPPMRRSVDGEEVRRFLAAIAGEGDGGDGAPAR